MSTIRVKLQQVELSDLTSVHDLLSLSEVDKYNTLGLPKDLAETKAILEQWIVQSEQLEPAYTFKIKDKKEGSFIGLIGLKLWSKKHRRAEVWFKIHPYFWNRGYATEALRLILNYSFNDLNLHRVQAGCAVDNLASIKVLEKVGMIREGRGRKVLPLKTGWSDNFEYSILESDSRT